MGTVYADIKLQNVKDIALAEEGYIKSDGIREVTVTSVVDTGAETLCITEDIFKKLGLDIERQKSATVADGRQTECSVSTPVKILWEDRDSVVRALVIPGSEEILLGAIPLEEMDLIVNPKNLKLIGAHGDKPLLRI
ncbi:MAG: clan AA aspartic protease [Treponema sp.]|nr:clan AA aspartic protease [Treponema sp.]